MVHLQLVPGLVMELYVVQHMHLHTSNHVALSFSLRNVSKYTDIFLKLPEYVLP